MDTQGNGETDCDGRGFIGDKSKLLIATINAEKLVEWKSTYCSNHTLSKFSKIHNLFHMIRIILTVTI